MNKPMRIRVTWCDGKGSCFFDNPEDAYSMTATLRMAGFEDARIDWASSYTRGHYGVTNSK